MTNTQLECGEFVAVIKGRQSNKKLRVIRVLLLKDLDWAIVDRGDV